jgi:hypothetical protein
MNLSHKDIDDLYFNNPDTLIVKDCTVLHIEEPETRSTFGLVFQISHIETGIQYCQMFLMSKNVVTDLTLLLEGHLQHERGNESSF